MVSDPTSFKVFSLRNKSLMTCFKAIFAKKKTSQPTQPNMEI